MGKPKVMEWSRNHKLLIFFIMAALCFFVSTVALATLDRDACKLIEHKPDNTTQDEKKIEDPNYYRLPRSVEPENYKLMLNPNTTNNSFAGSVLITISVKEKIKTIALHANNLTIHGISLTNNNSKGIRILSTNMSLDKRELLLINLQNELDIAQYKLFILFSGRLDNKIVGFYKSNLKSGGTMVASKFQPTYARQAFPCFDEPDFKATYDITLWKPHSYVALSNMNEISSVYDKNVQMDRVTFATSVPMSTYLACFVVCDFDYKEVDINSGGIGRNFKLRSFAQKQDLHKIDFALDIGKRATEFYINYYEVPFPLPKLG
uniref:SFRICE_035992 n=1 Tax=Spodoptera frugiperda TaxID=7108 RepID=A0A2H1V5U1_SPOFR